MRLAHGHQLTSTGPVLNMHVNAHIPTSSTMPSEFTRELGLMRRVRELGLSARGLGAGFQGNCLKQLV